MTMADRIAVMDAGKVLQMGSPREIYENPATRFVADFIGETNFIEGMLVSTDNDVAHIRLDEETVVVAQLPEQYPLTDGKVTIPIRPERIGLLPPNVAPPNSQPHMTELVGILTQSQYIGTDTRYTVKIAGDNEVVVRIQNVDYEEQYSFEEGQPVKVFWPLQSTHVLDH